MSILYIMCARLSIKCSKCESNSRIITYIIVLHDTYTCALRNDFSII